MRRFDALLLVLALTATAPAVAEPELAVAIKEAPPFAIQEADGSWSGVAVDLWRAMADELGLTFSLRAYELDALLETVRTGTAQAGLGAITVTAEREASLDFSHPFFSSGLGAAVPARAGSGWRGALERIASPAFLSALGALVVALLVAGLVVWLLERRRNAEQFGGGTAQGIGSGFWWAAVTMTTVGYGDKAPRTFGGRAVALVWMFFSIVTISGFTAAIASALTLSQLESSIRSSRDLARVRVASVPGTTSARYLQREGIGFQEFQSAEQALAAVAEGRADAVVYDAPILRHLIRSQWSGEMRMLPFTLERQDYAFVLSPGSELREPLNRALLRHIDDASWNVTLKTYLGDPED